MRDEDRFDKMLRHMSKNDALVHNLEQVSQSNSTQYDPVVVQMATELSRELNKAKTRREANKLVIGILIIFLIFVGVMYALVKPGYGK